MFCKYKAPPPRNITSPPFSGSPPQKKYKITIPPLYQLLLRKSFKFAATQKMQIVKYMYLKIFGHSIKNNSLKWTEWRSVFSKIMGRLLCLHFYWQETRFWGSVYNIHIKDIIINTSLQNINWWTISKNECMYPAYVK